MMELLAKKEEEILGKEEAGTIRTTRAPDICSMACHLFRDASLPEVGTQVSEAGKPGVHLKKSESDFYL